MKNIHGYEYKKQKRPKDYVPPTLSRKDEYIPNTHVGMYSLLRNPKNEAIYMGEEQCLNVRRKTFRALLTIFNEYNSPDYADLWNYNIAAINECGLNYFINNSKIAPLGNLIQCFEKLVVDSRLGGRFYGNTILYISFGIDKKLLIQYFKNVEDAKETGEEVKIPELPKLPAKSREKVLFGVETFTRKEGGEIELDRNATYNRFEHWCKLQGVSTIEGLTMAMETLFKCYPVDGLHEVKYYNVVTELDRLAFRPRLERGNEEVSINLSKVIYGKSKEIIDRYNLDPTNQSKGIMTFDTYANNALHLLNSHMPLKYQDPFLAKEKADTEKMEKEGE